MLEKVEIGKLIVKAIEKITTTNAAFDFFSFIWSK